MKRCLLISPLLLAALSMSPALAEDNAKSREIVKQMVEAHGGREAWLSAPSIRFHSHLKVHYGGDTWIPFWEEATADPRRRCVYAKLPNPDGTYGVIAHDGTHAWSAGDLKGIAKAPARFTAWRNFYLFNLPWMTQDQGVHFGPAGTGTLPGASDVCITVPMFFESGAGDTPRDTYTLYIDQKTHRLRGAEYVMTYKQMMQGGAAASAPSIFVWEDTETVDGLVVPTKYTVYWSKDHSVAVKDGAITQWSFNEPFDDSKLKMPPDGKPDASTP
jgi:hypothetical protein